MKTIKIALRLFAVSLLAIVCQGCDPKVYGSVGVSTGFGSYGGYGGGYRGSSSPRMHGSISVGGRIR